jgi:hypothetical protein
VPSGAVRADYSNAPKTALLEARVSIGMTPAYIPPSTLYYNLTRQKKPQRLSKVYGAFFWRKI